MVFEVAAAPAQEQIHSAWVVIDGYRAAFSVACVGKNQHTEGLGEPEEVLASALRGQKLPYRLQRIECGLGAHHILADCRHVHPRCFGMHGGQQLAGVGGKALHQAQLVGQSKDRHLHRGRLFFEKAHNLLMRIALVSDRRIEKIDQHHHQRAAGRRLLQIQEGMAWQRGRGWQKALIFFGGMHFKSADGLRLAVFSDLEILLREARKWLAIRPRHHNIHDYAPGSRMKDRDRFFVLRRAWRDRKRLRLGIRRRRQIRSLGCGRRTEAARRRALWSRLRGNPGPAKGGPCAYCEDHDKTRRKRLGSFMGAFHMRDSFRLADSGNLLSS